MIDRLVERRQEIDLKLTFNTYEPVEEYLEIRHSKKRNQNASFFKDHNNIRDDDNSV